MKLPPKSSAKIYRKAAERIEMTTALYCCDAIRREVPNDLSYNSKPIIFFEDLFKPENAHWINPWFGVADQQTQGARILALLLAAEIVERGKF